MALAATRMAPGPCKNKNRNENANKGAFREDGAR
jgi:hypothetical protein